MSAPSVREIFLFPLIGVMACHSFVTRHNELVFFLMPFLFVAVRLYMSQLQAPRELMAGQSANFERHKALSFI